MNITVENLKEVKADIAKIRPVISSIMEVWPSHKLTMVSVLIQNLVFFSPESHGFNKDVEYKRCRDILNTLRELSIYSTDTDHTINWIFEEISMSWDGYWMTVAQEEEEKATYIPDLDNL